MPPGLIVALILAAAGVLLLTGTLEYPKAGLSGMIGAGLPVPLGLGAARRGTLAMRRAGDSGGALSGGRAAYWVRLTGQTTVLVAAGVLVYRYGGYLIGLLYG